ncbi:response regulator [Variovorax rhizosphaerae]|uniref:Response regulator n=1 Tax=Variovorax rhizosphaerae TaxID=1836200 RepID=A0ABU8WX91_9BURK
MTGPAIPELRTVAILDDDAQLTASIARMLRRFHLRAVTFTDPAALAEHDGEEAFDAFVLDWLLVNTTPLELIESIRGRARNADVPIFLLTGNLAVGGIPSDPELLAAIDHHHLRYFAKPYSPIKLAQDLQHSLTGGST